MIDPKLEETFRKLISHAIHNRQDDMARVITEAGEEAYGQVAALAIQGAAYVVIDTAGRWPVDADLKEAGRIGSEALPSIPVTADDIYSHLKTVVFGSSGAVAGHPVIPLYALAALVAGFKPPKGTDWNDWLDVVESAIEAAGRARATDLPAMTYRYLKKQ